MKVKIKSLHPLAKVPAYATELSAGFDLVAVEPLTLYPGDRALAKTGLAVQLPEGYELQVRSRSGLALKNGVIVLNAPGTIDADYRGEIMVILVNTSEYDFIIQPGDRIAQGVVAQHEHVTWQVVEELTETDRGIGGFGSTGTR